MSARLLVLAIVVGLVAVACGGADASGPPEINYGRDICTSCGMIINEERFAAAYRPAAGSDEIFDDVGGMIIYGREHDQLESATLWVHDYETSEWTSAEMAYYVPTTAIASPMGHGILAFSDEGRAQQFAADLGADVITWGVLIELPVEDGLLGHHHGQGD